VQLPLPFDRATSGPHGALDASMDDLRDRFGSGAVTRAALLGKPIDWSPPMLPD